MIAIAADKLSVGDYIRWLKPLGNTINKDYIYGIIVSIIKIDTNEEEPRIKIMDTQTQKYMWLPLRLLVELGQLQLATEGGWLKVVDKP
jgi:hypothetical protein